MIKGFNHVGEDHKCNVCSCDFTEDEGGVLGHFGILPVAFCPTCYSSMVDMVSQDLELNPAEEEPNPEYDELIRQLKGIRRVVINDQHGGFGLSYDAKIKYLTLSDVSFTLQEQPDRDTQFKQGHLIMVNGREYWDRNIDRDDPVLVKVVQEMGADASGAHAKLKIVEIPADVEWQIDEYDGTEWVSEKHRTWS
jgi:hypothetical protein